MAMAELNHYLLAKPAEIATELGKRGWGFNKELWSDEEEINRQLADLLPDKLRFAFPENLGPIVKLIVDRRAYNRTELLLQILEQTKEDLIDKRNNHELKWILRWSMSENVALDKTRLRTGEIGDEWKRERLSIALEKADRFFRADEVNDADRKQYKALTQHLVR